MIMNSELFSRGSKSPAGHLPAARLAGEANG